MQCYKISINNCKYKRFDKDFFKNRLRIKNDCTLKNLFGE